MLTLSRRSLFLQGGRRSAATLPHGSFYALPLNTLNSVKLSEKKQNNEGGHRNHWYRNWHSYRDYSAIVAFSVIATTFASYNDKSSSKKSEVSVADSVLDDKYSSIIVGGGTAGCTVAYLTAKWMQENNIPGKVLLVDRGIDFFDAKGGPDPLMGGWFDNWGSYGESHPAVREDGTAHPVTGSDHRGIGGCGTHDTRITFQPAPGTIKRFARMMGWDDEQLYAYYQAALNLMPLTPSIPAALKEDFYSAILAEVPADMTRIPDDEYKALITVNSIALASVAAYPNEVRWTSALLLHPSVKPTNLVVLTNATADRVLLDRSDRDGSLKATGVVLQVSGAAGPEEKVVALDEQGEVVLTGGAFGATSVLQRSGIGPREALELAGVTVKVDNEHVGHGADHTEIAVLYGYENKWNNPDGSQSRGGVMGWPLVTFLPFRPEMKGLYPGSGELLSPFMMAHLGASLAEPYTEFPTVVCTPNCVRPDLNTGYRALITSSQPGDSLRLVHAEQPLDMQALAQGVFSIVKLLDHYHAQGIVGPRLEPPFPVTPENSEKLMAWINENHFTVFHWACTCQAGLNGRVADAHFRVRDTGLGPQARPGSSAVVGNLLVGSAASLPEFPDANPHLSITAFSFALAEELVRTQAERRHLGYRTPTELRRAQKEVRSSAAFKSAGDAAQPEHTMALQIRRPGQEYPDVSRAATEHYQNWLKAHSK